MSRRFRTVLSMLLVIGIVAAAQPAYALTVTPDDTWQVKGRVYALARSGDTIFLGGKFKKLLGPTGNPKPAALNVAALDMTTGEPVPGFAASVTNTLKSGAAEVRALAVSNDGSTLYLGGKFDTVNGELHANLAAVSATDGSLIPGFQVDANKPVNALLAGSDLVYFGGDFKRVNSKPRKFLGAVSLDGALSNDWKPSADNTIRSLETATDGNTVFVGGKFLTMNGVARTSVARVSSTDGSLDPWAIPPGVIDSGNPAWDLLATGNRLYGGFGNGPNYAAAFRLDNGTTGTQLWRRNTVGNIQGLAFNADGSRLFLAGHYGTGGLQQTACGVNLRGLMMVDPNTGTIDCSWIPQLVPFGSNFVGAWPLISTPTQLWVGGFFTSISGEPQQGIARFTL
ncbi:MAG: hypothetical protein ACRDGK_04210 [Actinomycetota bacterium]